MGVSDLLRKRLVASWPTAMAALLVLTLANVAVQVRRVSRWAGIELHVGDKLPFRLRSVAGGLADVRGSGCTAVFLCTPQCAACKVLASRMTSNSAMKFVLLSDDRAARDFAAAHGISSASVWVPDGRRDVRLLGTPTRVVLDGQARVRQFELSGDELPADSISRLCSVAIGNAPFDDLGSQRLGDVSAWSPINGRSEVIGLGGEESRFDNSGRPSIVEDARRHTLGPAFDGIRDAIMFDTRIAVLAGGDQSKTRLLLLREGTPKWIADTLGRQALSLVAVGKRIGVWRPDSAVVTWFDTLGLKLGSTTFSQLQKPDLATGYLAPLSPRRSYGRLFHAAGQYYIESRPMREQRLGDVGEAYVLRMTESGADTLLAFRAPSYSIAYGSGRACCLPPRVFASQPAWAVFRDGGIAVSPSGGSRLLTFDAGGNMLAQIHWETRSRAATDGDRIAHFRGYTLTHLYAAKSESEKKRDLAVFRRDLMRNRTFFGDTIPDVTGLVIDSEGRIWVRRSNAARPFARADVWDLYSRDLRDHSVVQMRGMHELFAIGPAAVLGSVLVSHGRERLTLVPIPTLSIHNR